MSSKTVPPPSGPVTLLLVLLLLPGACTSFQRQLCSGRIVFREGGIRLDSNERVLVCGQESGPEGWRDVPLPQARYQLGVYLQRRGYFHPRFERDGDRLVVWTGPRETVKRLEVRGGDGLLDPGKKRKVVGEPITSDVLDDVRGWAETELRVNGYPCPDVGVTADAWDGTVLARARAGRRLRVGRVTFDGLESVDSDALSRYFAFRRGDWHDARASQLTASRLMIDGLFQSAQVTSVCEDETAGVQLAVTEGKPRVVRFGVGASTEEFPFARLWYKDARLDRRASSFSALLYASPRLQSLETGAEFFRLPWSPNAYIGPRVTVEREVEHSYEVLRGKAGVDLGRLTDRWGIRWRWRAGPTYNYVDTVTGIGPEARSYLSWDGALRATSLTYELYSREQFDGWQAGVDFRAQRRGIGSPVNVDRLEANFRHLWNLGDLAPPLFVLGSRFQIAGATAKSVELLPTDDRVFFGGDQNLRGFPRKSLDNAGLGYITAVYFGAEARLVRELPLNLEPLLLFDVARLGVRPFALDPPLFTSLGFGLRWPFFFGTLRGSAAKGNIVQGDAASRNYPRTWVYFLSFGQEF